MKQKIQASEPRTITIPSFRALKKKKSSLDFLTKLFKLQQNLPSFAFSKRPFYTPTLDTKTKLHTCTRFIQVTDQMARITLKEPIKPT